MIKIYTKTGDKGETDTLGGKRISKSCLEMDAIGEVDELNAELGILVAELSDDKSVIPAKAGILKREQDPCFRRDDKKEWGNDVVGSLVAVQHNLFIIGSNLAGLQTDLENISKLENSQVLKLEKLIDEMENVLPELKNFILPGGDIAAAQSYLARAVCRRAERCLIGLSQEYEIDDVLKQYLNRLSDYLFVLARWINFKSGTEEVKWGKK